jgi:phospholipid-binding lipoprotein MlaA
MSKGLDGMSSPAGVALAAQETPNAEEPFAKEHVAVADPLEGLNRAFFKFNDKLYFWALKPVSTVYGTIIPEGVRVAIRNAFHNVAMPIRAVNCALQGKGEAFGTELGRFVINSTLGIGGLFDFAGREFNLQPHDEDTGQTFGVWGMKPVMYINWPFLGPSSLRDSLGQVGDYFLNPIYYLSPNWYVSAGIKTGKIVNNTSLILGEYEDFKKSALDPYVSMRDAYIQYREEEVRK